MIKTFTAIIQKEEDMYVAKCAEIGTTSQGHTVEEAIENLKEATELYLEEFPEKLNDVEQNSPPTFSFVEV